MNDDDDDDRSDVDLGQRTTRLDATREIDALCGELVELLKNPDAVASLTARGVNASLALLAMDGVRAYLAGQKAQAADDLRTVAEEIEGRLQFGNDPPSA